VQLPVIMPILEKRGADRTPDELDTLAVQFAKMAFFEKVRVSVDARWDFCKTCLVKKFETVNQLIIRQGDKGSSFFIVLEGSLTITKTDEQGKSQDVATLVAGDSFGELSLLYGQPRAASVVVDQPSTCLVVLKSDYDKLVKPWHERDEQDCVAFLRNVRSFRRWPEDRLRLLANKFILRRFHASDAIAKEGQIGGELMFVFRGQVRLIKFPKEPESRLKEQPWQETLNVGQMWRGDVIDPISTFAKSPLQYSLYAVTMVDLLVLPQEDVRRLIDTDTMESLQSQETALPSGPELLEIVEQEQRWKRYKRELCNDVLRESSKASRLLVQFSAAEAHEQQLLDSMRLPQERDPDMREPQWAKFVLKGGHEPISQTSSPQPGGSPALCKQRGKVGKFFSSPRTAEPMEENRIRVPRSQTKSAPGLTELQDKVRQLKFEKSGRGWCNPSRADKEVLGGNTQANTARRRRRYTEDGDSSESDESVSDPNASVMKSLIPHIGREPGDKGKKDKRSHGYMSGTQGRAGASPTKGYGSGKAKKLQVEPPTPSPWAAHNRVKPTSPVAQTPQTPIQLKFPTSAEKVNTPNPFTKLPPL